MIRYILKKPSPNYKTVRKQFQYLIDTHCTIGGMEEALRSICLSYPNQHLKYKKAFFEVMKDIDTLCAIKYAEEVVMQNTSDISLLHVLAVRQYSIGNKKRYLELIELINTELLKDKSSLFKRKFSIKIFKGTLLFMLENKTKEEVQNFIEKELKSYKKYRKEITKNAFIFLKDNYIDLALGYGDMALEKGQDKKFIKVMFTRAKRIDDIERMSMYAALLNNPLSRYYKILFDNKSRINGLLRGLEDNSIRDVTEDLNLFLDKYSSDRDVVYFLFGELYFNYNKEKSIEYLENALNQKDTFFSYEILFNMYVKKGLFVKALDILPSEIKSENLLKNSSILQENMLLMENRSFYTKNNLEFEYKRTNKVMYMLYNTLPYHSGGYAVRSHEILKGFNKVSETLSMIGVSRLAYPNDIVKHINEDEVPREEIVDNQRYLRLPSSIKKGSISYLSYIEMYSDEIISLAKKEKPLILHASSNFLNGLATVRAAKHLGLTSIYEIRGLWEVTAISNNPELEGSDLYKLQSHLETQAALGVDKVIVITNALKNEMIKRGIPEDKIEVIPNGVDTSRFSPVAKDIVLCKELNLENKIIIGYVGSFVAYEGIDNLVSAIDILVNEKNIRNLAVLMVGDGVSIEKIHEQVKLLELSEYFTFTGRVKYKDVKKYYSLIDITPFPRKGLPVCEMVSPLKPLEAMSMGKAVIASGVAALKEMVKDGYTGLIFEKDNVRDLADKLEMLIGDEKLRESLGKRARKWVQKEREWDVVVEKLHNIYMGAGDLDE